jgi:hypothetical protein
VIAMHKIRQVWYQRSRVEHGAASARMSVGKGVPARGLWLESLWRGDGHHV